MAAGWGLMLWANRLMPDPPGPDTDPLAPEAAPSTAQTPPPAVPVREVAYADRNRTGLPPLLAWGLTFVSASAMAVALIAGALGRFWDASLGIPMSLLMALAVTAADWVGRKRTGPNKKAGRKYDRLSRQFSRDRDHASDIGFQSAWGLAPSAGTGRCGVGRVWGCALDADSDGGNSAGNNEICRCGMAANEWGSTLDGDGDSHAEAVGSTRLYSRLFAGDVGDDCAAAVACARSRSHSWPARRMWRFGVILTGVCATCSSLSSPL